MQKSNPLIAVTDESQRTTQIITSSWTPQRRKFMMDLSRSFEKSSFHHHLQKGYWDRIAIICTVITMALTFSAIVLEATLSGEHKEVTRYFNMGEKVAVMTVSFYVLIANPSRIARKHDRCRTNYIEMMTRVSAQINRDESVRKNYDLLMEELRSKYIHTIEIHHPPDEISNEVGWMAEGELPVSRCPEDQ